MNLGWAATGAIVAPSILLATKAATNGQRSMALLIVTFFGAIGVGMGAAFAARARTRYWRGPVRVSLVYMVVMWVAVFLAAWALFAAWPESTELASPGQVNAVTSPRGGIHPAFRDRFHVEASTVRALVCLAGFGFMGGTLSAWRLSPTSTVSTALRVILVGTAASCAVLIATYITTVGFYLGFAVLARVVRANAATIVVSGVSAGAVGGAIGGALAEAVLFSVIGQRLILRNAP